MPFGRTAFYSPPSNLPQKLERPQRVAVVGGGLAGAAAATVLAERGAQVVVFEKEHSLGGRLGGWHDTLATGERFEMERGFHAFFRQYYNLRAFLRRVDPDLQRLVPCEDYPLWGPEGRQESFSRLPKRPPLNLIAVMWRTSTMRMWDALKLNHDAARAMLAFDMERTYADYDHLTARDYLDSLNFPTAARQMLFNVFAHSFFNPEENFSAAELLMMFHYYFLGNPEGIVFDVLNAPFGTAVWNPLRDYLEARQVALKLGATVQGVERSETGWRVRSDGAEVAVDAVVSALNVPALQKLVKASPTLGDGAWRSQIERLEVTLPFAVWRLWFDKPTQPGRAPFVGTTGLGHLDNISLYHLFESESREWAERSGGSVIELHAYAVPEEVGEAELKADLLSQLHALYPETRGATILEERFLLRRDCPAFAPGSFGHRPTVNTPSPGFFVAGDMVRLPIPTALMERAVTSGILAANHFLESQGVAGDPVWSVPPRGMMA